MNNGIDDSILTYIKSLTLLCVEDNKTTQLLYQSVFEELVKCVVFADNGEDGYQKYKSKKIDLIIVDYAMPILNGIDMIKKIRDNDKEIPIILVSAIQDIDIIVQALQLNVNNFLKKPIIISEVMQAVENVSKLLFADNYLKKQREKKIKELEKKEKYSLYQEDLAFSKELNIVRNDFYYQMIDDGDIALIDFFYKPLDILSGDAYSARRIDTFKTFYFIADGMGKGLSASLSSMIITTFVNYLIDKMGSSFNLREIVDSAIDYIKPILLDEETLSLDFILLDYKNFTMQYAKFSMPPSLIHSSKDKIIPIKSNNPPLSKYTTNFLVSTRDISGSVKFLFYSDGVVENSLRVGNEIYANYIKDDFLSSFTKDELREKILFRTDVQEDDMTFIFINRLSLSQPKKHLRKKFQSSLNALEEANEWYADIWSTITDESKLLYSAGIV
ncbi:MAG: fused response regulator/phosphatase, partial [Sulfurimonas sp.]